MNNLKLASQIDQHQLSIAQRQQADRDTSFYELGLKEGRMGKFRPSRPEIPEWYAGWAEEYRKFCINTNHLVEYGGNTNRQGYLLASYSQIKKMFGELYPIGEFNGWQVKLDGLDIKIITIDHEDPKSETEWEIEANHISALRHLAMVFGFDRVVVNKPKRFPFPPDAA